MGHIDSGKTTFIDKIKGTSITKQEPGKITQHIGATEITLDVIRSFCGDLLKKYNYELTIPGLLFIDTPGHNVFDNLRERGGSLADLVVLVTDINKGLQAQDIESIKILKMYKVPFIILANKIDLIYGWFQEGECVTNVLNNQSRSVSEKLDELIYKIVGQLFDLGFQADRYDYVKDFTKQIVIIPTSVLKGWGLPESLLYLCVLSQRFLGQNLVIDESQHPKGTILEVGEIKGVGPTIDVILYQGILRVKDEIAYLTRDGVKFTKIKALLKPPVISGVIKKKDYESVEFVSAASGVKIVAPGLENVIPGSWIASSKDKQAIEHLNINIQTFCNVSNEEGVFVKADTLGSLEALLKLLEKENICVGKSDIGDVSKKDIMELKVLNEKNPKKGVLFLFNVNIPKELEDELLNLKIPVFKNNIIYKIVEDYLDWLNKINREEQENLLKEIIFPCRFQILKEHIFRKSKPAIVGVKVLVGKLYPHARVVDKTGKEVGVVESIEVDGKQIDHLDLFQEAAIAIKDAVYEKDFVEDSILETLLTYENIKKLEMLDYSFSDKELELINKAKLKYTNAK
jgi:translation initiation factor 5B